VLARSRPSALGRCAGGWGESGALSESGAGMDCLRPWSGGTNNSARLDVHGPVHLVACFGAVDMGVFRGWLLLGSGRVHARAWSWS